MKPLTRTNPQRLTNLSINELPDSFRLFQERFLTSSGKEVSNITQERESSEYAAIRFEMDGKPCLFRQAKHTPTKIGQFVTLWKRPTPTSEIAPYDQTDGIDSVFIFADEQTRNGVFVFNSRLLLEKDVFSKNSQGGKRAFRVYAPWIMPDAAQAKRSKIWQCAHFVEFTNVISS